jgi:hypothetical protein
MATDLARAAPQAIDAGEQRERMLSLPVWLGSLIGSMAEVNLPGEGTKKYLPAGLTLTPEQKVAIEQRRAIAHFALDADAAQKKPRLGLIAKLLLSYPVAGGGSERSGEARAEAYMDALDDVPAWALDKAIRGWHRGEVGEHNYSFAPAPAVLRAVCKRVLAPYRKIHDDMVALLNAKPLAEVLNASHTVSPKVVSGLNELSKSLGNVVDQRRQPNPAVAEVAAAARARQAEPQPEAPADV